MDVPKLEDKVINVGDKVVWRSCGGCHLCVAIEESEADAYYQNIEMRVIEIAGNFFELEPWDKPELEFHADGFSGVKWPVVLFPRHLRKVDVSLGKR